MSGFHPLRPPSTPVPSRADACDPTLSNPARSPAPRARDSVSDPMRPPRRFPPPARGVWVSLDLLLALLILFSLLSGLLLPIALSNSYATRRAAYAQRVSDALALSEQAYLSASAPAPSIGARGAYFQGYLDESAFRARLLTLPASLSARWVFSLDAPVLDGPTAPSRVCVSRALIDPTSSARRELWVCERAGTVLGGSP